MQGLNGTHLNSKIKVRVFINEEDIKIVSKEVEEMLNEILITKCGAGNFLYEVDVQY